MRPAVIVSALALAVATLAPGAAYAAKDPAPTPTQTKPPLTGYGVDGLGGFDIETVSYGSHRRQAMDVWWTADGMKRPGVFLIHGGWWNSGDKKYMTEITRGFADLGYTVFNLNYRLAPDSVWPAQRVDTIDAIMTARRHAERWSFDPNNYVVVGFSAGGHLAASVGTYGDGALTGLKGVVGISPVISPLRAYTDGGGVAADINQRRLRAAAIDLAGGCEPKGKCSRIWASMEVPWHASRKDVPMLSVHSQNEFVPPAQSQLLKEMLGQVGVPMTIVTAPGIGHSSPLYREPGVTERVHKWVEERTTVPS